MSQHLSGFKLPCLHKLNSQWCFRQVLIVCTIPTEFTQQPFIIDALWFNRNSQLTLQLTSQKIYEKNRRFFGYEKPTNCTLLSTALHIFL